MVMRKTLIVLARIGLPVIVATAVVSGQGTPKPTPPNQQGTIFRAAANYVTEDIVPRDSTNRFVSDLKKTEFQIFEDGVEQKLETFKPFIGGRDMGVSDTRPPVTVSEGIILPVAPPPRDISGRVFIIFIDDLHLQPLLTPRVKDLLREIKDTLLHEGDLIAIVSSGPSSIEINQTYDLNRIDEAKRRIMGSGQSPKEIIQMPQTSEGPKLLRYNVRVAFGVVYDMLMQLEKVTNRRKAFIYISSGYDFNPFTNGRLKYEQEQFGTNNNANDGKTGFLIDHPIDEDPFSKQGQQFAETDLVAELAELTRAANRANASFYTIDPRGLMSNMADISDDLTTEDWGAFVQTSQSSLRVLADETGGIAIVNMNDFKKGLSEIDNATSDYYILGYYSSNPDPLRRKRNIEIKVTRPGVHLSPYRTTYELKRPTIKKG